MKKHSSEIIDITAAFWSNFSGKNMTNEDARQAVENISGFFRVLEDWQLTKRGGAQPSNLIENEELSNQNKN